MSFWMYILLSVVVLTIIAAVGGSRLSKKAAKQAGKLFQAADERYEQFIEKRLTISILKKNDFNIDTKKIIQEVRIILKPEIDGIIAHINATTNASSVKIEYESRYFGNAVRLAEELFNKTNDSNSAMDKKDEEEMSAAFEHAIEADLARRILDLQTGL